MNDYLAKCVDYIEGKLLPADFEIMLESNPDFTEWLQSIVPSTKTMYIWDATVNNVVQLPYRIDIKLKDCESIQVGGPKGSIDYQYVVHKEITDLISEAFPELKLAPDRSIKEDYELCMEACPRYIGGVEIAKANILGALLSAVPRTLSKVNRKREAKQKILEVFHIEGKKYPKWKQEPEWPVYNGHPMKYVRTEKVNSEVSIHYFVDVESGVERSVEDAF